ncbi:MAG: dihydroneopterin aldolase [Verrucomicrobiota bacterium]
MNDRIVIQDLEVSYHLGVPEEERSRAQRLLVSVEMVKDFSRAALTDDLRRTVDYYAVSQRLLKFGDGRSWKLMEKLATDIAEMVLKDFETESVTVTVKKFIIPQAQYVAVQLTRARK